MTAPMDLLQSKLVPPRLGPSLVRRDTLLAQLDAALDSKLTLLHAPAGYGKTTAASQWVRERMGEGKEERTLAGVAWLALDPGDNDPLRFWRYVIAACRRIRSDIGQEALQALEVVQPTAIMPDSLEPALTLLLNDLSGLPGHGLLVLEDYHVINVQRIHESVAFVVEHLPLSMHLILLSRTEPPLPLARLRARGELLELSADALRFTPGESERFMEKTLPFSLDTAMLARLDRRTEGWAAGLRLVSLALRQCATAREAATRLGTFSGDQRHVREYLLSDVLDVQEEGLQTFLLQTSVLPELTPSLCNAVTGRADSADLLARLDRQNFFILPLDGEEGAYRYHALFAEAMLYAAYERLGEEEVRRCYQRASLWCERHGRLSGAVDAALAAGEWERAASLIESFIEPEPVAGAREPHTLNRWLSALPPDVLHARPLLCFAFAFTLLHLRERPVTAMVEQLEELAQHAEQGWLREENERRLGQLYAARALFGLWTGRMDQAIHYSQRALPLLPADDVTWRAICLGFAGHAAMRAGRFDRARPLLQEARALSDAAFSRPGTRAHMLMLGEISAEQGEGRQAAVLFREVLTDALDDEDLYDAAKAQLGLARYAYERNELLTSEKEAQEALALAGRAGDKELQLEIDIHLCRVWIARGELQKVEQRLARLLADTLPSHAPLRYRALLACRAGLRLAAGNLPAVRRWMATRHEHDVALTLEQQVVETLLVARACIAGGEPEKALPLLERVADAARNGDRLRTLLQCRLLMALGRAALGTEDALDILRDLLIRARDLSFLRLFLDEGEPLADLLRRLIPTLEESPLRRYAQTLLQEYVQTRPDDPADTLLSPQELRVLRLLATGRSNPEIARELVVSVNTIKTQLRYIYRKLGVSSREEACDVAAHLNLL